MKILFIGDIVGKIGRRVIKDHLQTFVDKYHIDFVIANGENVTHGKGILKHHYLELIDSGIDTITLGKDTNIIVYYKSGVRSEEAVKKLADLGYTSLYNLDGGIINWGGSWEE